MIERLIVSFFGGPWRLKLLCQKTSCSYLKKILILIYRFYNYENCSSVAWNANFLGEPCFPHGWKNIFISGNAHVGINCVIFQQVSIGSNNIPGSKGLGGPRIGANCYIGAGAKVVGGITIGNNCRIGANAVVYKNVPDNSTVVSGEQKNIISNEPLINKFYSYRHGRRVYFDNGIWVEETDPNILNIFSERHSKLK